MQWIRRSLSPSSVRRCLLTLALVTWALAAPASLSAIGPRTKPSVPSIQTAVPENVEELRAQEKVQKNIVKRVLPCTVNVQVGQAQGSGVIISKDGYVLTAGHVSGTTDRSVTVTLFDGRKFKGKTLGGNRLIDSGLIKITEGKDWPFVEMGKSSDLRLGQWCVSTGHPRGLMKDRTPPVRVGRIHTLNKSWIVSDCTLVGGDSGGPLFDMDGRVIGIHSRIGLPITNNVHVPVDTYRETWTRLVASEIWGGPFGEGAYLGIQGATQDKNCKITTIEAGSPAEKAGLKVDDVVLKFDDRKIAAYKELTELVRKKRPGEAVSVEIRRGDKTMTLKLSMGKQKG